MNDIKPTAGPAKGEDQIVKGAVGSQAMLYSPPISHPAIVCGSDLLPMWSRLQEFVDELMVGVMLVRDWRRIGFAFQDDTCGDIWNDGGQERKGIEADRDISGHSLEWPHTSLRKAWKRQLPQLHEGPRLEGARTSQTPPAFSAALLRLTGPQCP